MFSIKSLTSLVISILFAISFGTVTIAKEPLHAKDDAASMHHKPPSTSCEVKATETALMIIDFENFVAHPQGVMGTEDIYKYIVDHHVVQNTKLAIEKARAANVPIIYVKMSLHPRIMAHFGFFKRLKEKVEMLTPEQREWNYQVVDDLRPQPGDFVVWKGNWTNGFRQTMLPTIVHELGIKRLVITGLVEPACVYGTFLGAVDDGIAPIMLSDCTVPEGPNRERLEEVHDFSVNIFYPTMGATVTTSKDLKFVH